jgi:hypothetical protein
VIFSQQHVIFPASVRATTSAIYVSTFYRELGDGVS